MVEKGFSLTLRPGEFPKHARLLEKIKRSRAWKIEEPPPKLDLTKEEPEPSESDKLLPHQRDVVNRIQAARTKQADPPGD
jgi:hypothetical protein